jgi:hypothetical protein
MPPGIRAATVRERTSPPQAVGMVLRQGLMLAGAGLLIGLPVAAAVAPLGASLLHGVPVLNPVTLVAVPLLLMAPAAIASMLPAWKPRAWTRSIRRAINSRSHCAHRTGSFSSTFRQDLEIV